MITVIEIWQLKPGILNRSLEIMQKMDDLLGPSAHHSPGWSGHARFLKSEESPDKVLMIYNWRSRELHSQLVKEEAPKLEAFYEEYCLAPRIIHYYEELEVDVDHQSISHS